MSNALLVAWRSESENRGWGPVGRLEYDGALYRFVYTQGARTLDSFRPFPQMENLDEIYESTDLFPIFANRLLPESRPEYRDFLTWGGFDPDDPPDPISLLGVTEGIRQTDSVEVFPCPSKDSGGCYVNKFFAHGLRWLGPTSLERLAQLSPGEQLGLMADFSNESDQNAVALRTIEGERILVGYVPRYLARDVWRLASECSPWSLSVIVERLNPDAPLQQRLLCRMNSCWPEDFQPCSDETFLPIPEGVSSECPS